MGAIVPIAVVSPVGAAGGNLTGTYPNPTVHGSNTSSTAAASTPAFANGTAAQLAQVTQDATVYLTVGTAGTAFTINIGPTSGVADTVVPSSSVASGQVFTVRLPAGWWLKWAATTATLAGQLAVTC